MSKPWIKRPVVALGLAFNAAYLAYYLFGGGADARPTSPTLRAPREPPSGVISRGAADTAPTTVYPAEDLILVSSEGGRLLFSPSYSAQDGPRGSHMVNLRFYSFSRAPQYSINRQLRIMADGREVWLNPAAEYSLDEGAGGEAVESLIDRMPLDVFAWAFSAKVVKITVGPEEIKLSPGQLGSLHRMAGCAYGHGCAR